MQRVRHGPDQLQQCVNLQTDNADCGACGVSCGGGELRRGACSVPPGRAHCNGACAIPTIPTTAEAAALCSGPALLGRHLQAGAAGPDGVRRRLRGPAVGQRRLRRVRRGLHRRHHVPERRVRLLQQRDALQRRMHRHAERSEQLRRVREPVRERPGVLRGPVHHDVRHGPHRLQRSVRRSLERSFRLRQMRNLCPNGATCVTARAPAGRAYEVRRGVSIRKPIRATAAVRKPLRCGHQCLNGACAPGCPTGQTSCNGRCVDTQTNTRDCGGCGNACPTGATCNAGACSAPRGRARARRAASEAAVRRSGRRRVGVREPADERYRLRIVRNSMHGRAGVQRRRVRDLVRAQPRPVRQRLRRLRTTGTTAAFARRCARATSFARTGTARARRERPTAAACVRTCRRATRTAGAAETPAQPAACAPRGPAADARATNVPCQRCSRARTANLLGLLFAGRTQLPSPGGALVEERSQRLHEPGPEGLRDREDPDDGIGQDLSRCHARLHAHEEG